MRIWTQITESIYKLPSYGFEQAKCTAALSLNQGRENHRDDFFWHQPLSIPSVVLRMVCGLVFASFLLHANIVNAQDPKLILTPKPLASPHINGPKIYGARMGHSFLYRIPCTGAHPIQFSAKDLPASLQLDSATGIISGSAPRKAGKYSITLTAKNSAGTQHRTFKLVVGERLGLTPQMGWNDWYTHYDRITAEEVRQAAEAMIESGMADYGYQFIGIDDAWAAKPSSDDPALNIPPRDASGALVSNKNFPDMKGLTDYIHSKGLKVGIYTSPGPLTCAKHEGSYGHEELDARRFADWGFDLLKYDYCSYSKVVPNPSLEDLKKPYIKMGEIIKNLDRDIVFNICQYGKGDVWNWGATVGGNSWRTTGDLGNAKDADLPGFYQIGFANALHAQSAGPGGWNDPDYLILGRAKNSHNRKAAPEPTHLTGDEQYSYMSMWALMASPLFFSGDMGALDEFTLNILCNSEVIDIDQDPLGRQGRIVRKNENEFIMAKQLEDGALAVGLFNVSGVSRTLTVTLGDLGIHGRRKLHDVWRQRDLFTSNKNVTVQVPSHGVVLVRLDRLHTR
jgi:alpha-galactosidase